MNTLETIKNGYKNYFFKIDNNNFNNDQKIDDILNQDSKLLKEKKEIENYYDVYKGRFRQSTPPQNDQKYFEEFISGYLNKKLLFTDYIKTFFIENIRKKLEDIMYIHDFVNHILTKYDYIQNNTFDFNPNENMIDDDSIKTIIGKIDNILIIFKNQFKSSTFVYYLPDILKLYILGNMMIDPTDGTSIKSYVDKVINKYKIQEDQCHVKLLLFKEKNFAILLKNEDTINYYKTILINKDEPIHIILVMNKSYFDKNYRKTEDGSTNGNIDTYKLIDRSKIKLSNYFDIIEKYITCDNK
jgi:hypothetical protein